MGLWINTKLVDDNVLFVDSEGLGGSSVDVKHDTNIFALSILISSLFIYNSTGAISTQQIDQLHIASRVSEIISKSSNSNATFQPPDFCWVLRDFTLDMRDKSGRTLTSTEYLKHVLDDADRGADSTSHYLKNLFKTKCCVALPPPATTVGNTRDMTNLLPEFEKGVDELKEVIGHSLPKRVGNGTVSGRILVKIAETFVDVINKGNMPDFSNVWAIALSKSKDDFIQSTIALIEKRWSTIELTTHFYRNAIRIAMETLNEQLKNSVIPLESSDLLTILSRIVTCLDRADEKNWDGVNNIVTQIELESGELDVVRSKIETLPVPTPIRNWLIDVFHIFQKTDADSKDELSTANDAVQRAELRLRDIETELDTAHKASSIDLCRAGEDVLTLRKELDHTQSELSGLESKYSDLLMRNMDSEREQMKLKVGVDEHIEEIKRGDAKLIHLVEKTEKEMTSLSSEKEYIQKLLDQRVGEVKTYIKTNKKQEELINRYKEDCSSLSIELKQYEFTVRKQQMEYETRLAILQTKLVGEAERAATRKTDCNINEQKELAIRSKWYVKRHEDDLTLINSLEKQVKMLERRLMALGV
jgi:hypothetical protein